MLWSLVVCGIFGPTQLVRAQTPIDFLRCGQSREINIKNEKFSCTTRVKLLLSERDKRKTVKEHCRDELIKKYTNPETYPFTCERTQTCLDEKDCKAQRFTQFVFDNWEKEARVECIGPTLTKCTLSYTLPSAARVILNCQDCDNPENTCDDPLTVRQEKGVESNSFDLVQ
jgi:hypothetical protein